MLETTLEVEDRSDISGEKVVYLQKKTVHHCKTMSKAQNLKINNKKYHNVLYKILLLCSDNLFNFNLYSNHLQEVTGQ